MRGREKTEVIKRRKKQVGGVGTCECSQHVEGSAGKHVSSIIQESFSHRPVARAGGQSLFPSRYNKTCPIYI